MTRHQLLIFLGPEKCTNLHKKDFTSYNLYAAVKYSTGLELRFFRAYPSIKPHIFCFLLNGLAIWLGLPDIRHIRLIMADSLHFELDRVKWGYLGQFWGFLNFTLSLLDNMFI